MPDDGRRDRWIPGLFIAFFVGLICVEIWFVTIAHTTFSGLVTDYAETTPLGGEAETQDGQLRWRHVLRFDDQGSLRGRLVLATRDANQQPLAGATVEASAERMSRFPQILPLNFVERAPGVFEADLDVPLGGPWFVRLKVSERGGQSAHWIEEVEVAP